MEYPIEINKTTAITKTGLLDDAVNDWAAIVGCKELIDRNIATEDEFAEELQETKKHYRDTVIERCWAPKDGSFRVTDRVIELSDPNNIDAYDALVDAYNQEVQSGSATLETLAKIANDICVLIRGE